MELVDQMYLWLVSYGTQLLGAILFLIAGFWITSFFVKQIVKVMVKKEVDPGLVSFSKGLLNILLKILIIISVMGMVGVEMTSFIAILGAAGLAIGLAFQGTLGNLAGGMMILLFKPFKVGDFIEAQGVSGSVTEILMFSTVLITPDNKTVIMPNGNLANNTITNFTKMETRRVEWTFGVAYGTDYVRVHGIINNIIQNDARILKDPEAFIGLSEMADSSINIKVRVWTATSDFWAVFFDTNQKVYKTFNNEGIEIPFPQMDVHLKNSQK